MVAREWIRCSHSHLSIFNSISSLIIFHLSIICFNNLNYPGFLQIKEFSLSHSLHIFYIIKGHKVIIFLFNHTYIFIFSHTNLYLVTHLFISSHTYLCIVFLIVGIFASVSHFFLIVDIFA